MQRLWRDVRCGEKVRRRSPGVSAEAILVLALAIGVNTAVFSEWDWTSALTVRDWRDQSEAFADVALVLRPEGSRGEQVLQTSTRIDPIAALRQE